MADPTTDRRVQELEAEVASLRALLASAPSFVALVDREGRFKFMNRVGSGYTEAEVLRSTMYEFVPDAYQPRAREAMQRVFETAEPQAYETIGAAGPGRVAHYLTQLSPVAGEGPVERVVLVATDVSELYESRARLELVVRSAGMGLWTFEPARNAGSWDDTTREIFGVPLDTPAPDLAVLIAERVHPDDRARVEAQLAGAIATGRYEPIEHRVVRPDGEVRWVAASGVGLRGEDGTVTKVVGGVRDLTEQRRLEQRLLEAEKLESIGRLAGGIAHDFNNMLTTILGSASFAAAELPGDSPAQPYLAEVVLAAERSAALTSQLLAFARRQAIEPRIVDPSTLVERMLPLLERTLGERIRVVRSGHAVGRVRADPVQLERVILNLATNARDAMPDGGTLTLTVEDGPSGPEGATVRLVVSDTGRGVPAEALPHVFEPFFTTRAEGVGLGLATCYGIVKQSGGQIDVESVEGVGTTFRVTLPSIPPQEAEPTGLTAAEARNPTGHRILVVEDEALVRGALERMLARIGFRVEATADGQEALVRLATEDFDLVVTDVVMPGMTGLELAAALHAQRPDLRVLFVSGYSEDAFAGGRLPAGAALLQKPFLPEALIAAVRAQLSRD